MPVDKGDAAVRGLGVRTIGRHRVRSVDVITAARYGKVVDICRNAVRQPAPSLADPVPRITPHAPPLAQSARTR